MNYIELEIKKLIDAGKFPQLSYTINENNEIIFSGFRDAHCHIWGLGIKYLELDLSDLNSIEECINVIAQAKPNRGNWIIGRGWNQELWKDAKFPDKEILDKIFPNNPVALKRVDGHSLWVNSKALEISECHKIHTNPAGGEIIRNSNNSPTGILIDNAMNIVEKYIPNYTLNQLQNLINCGIAESKKVGLTTLYDMDVSPLQIKIFNDMADKSQLDIHIKSYISGQNDEYINTYPFPFKNNNFELAGVKFYLDGALGSRGAALLEPYSDDLNNYGLLLLDEDTFYYKADFALSKGFEIATHAIGDRANRLLINVYEKLRKKYPYAILKAEHSQIINANDIKRFADNGIIASVQPIHCVSDADMAIKRLGNYRCEHNAYLWNTLLENNILLIAGSDFPIESHHPLKGIDVFVNRKSISKNEDFFPNERISLEQALIAYIHN